MLKAQLQKLIYKTSIVVLKRKFNKHMLFKYDLIFTNSWSVLFQIHFSLQLTNTFLFSEFASLNSQVAIKGLCCGSKSFKMKPFVSHQPTAYLRHLKQV